jgi:predicted Zn-dependent peptidase
VQQFTAADARWFTSRYYRPDNAVFFVYGDISFERLTAMLRTLPQSQPVGKENSRSPETGGNDIPLAPDADNTKQEEVIHHQAHVMIGCRAYSYDDKRRLPLFLLNNILGGPGMNARLNISLRERHGLVYTVESTMASYSDTGVWCVYFGCDHHDVKRCLRLVGRELDRFVQHPLSDRQLAAAKRQLKGQLTIACDNREQYALDLAKNFLHYGKERNIETLLSEIDAITSQQIQQLAQELFVPSRLQQLIL